MEKAHSNQNYNGNAGVGSKGVAALITVPMMQQYDKLSAPASLYKVSKTPTG